MKFRPCIDLHSGKVKQIVGSTLSDVDGTQLQTNFETETGPQHFATMYKKDNLYGGHVIMLGPDNKDAAFESLGAFKGGLQVGGGVIPDNALCYLNAGASHVIVTSYVFQNGQFKEDSLSYISSIVGRDKLVLDLSCKMKNGAYWVVTDRWQRFTSLQIDKRNLAFLAKYCDEFLVHAAEVEGKQQGVDEDLISFLADISPIPTTYAGGIRSLADLELVNTLGKGRIDATVGSALDIFGGSLPYRDVVDWHNQKQL